MQDAVEREVPLPQVLDRLTAGADLEAQQTQQMVVVVQGVGDAAQVVVVSMAVIPLSDPIVVIRKV